MNTVKDLRQALSDEVKRLEPPAGLEARVLQQALSSSAVVVPAHRAERRGAGGSWEPKRRAEFAAGIAAVVLAAIVVGTFAYIRLATSPHTVAPPITTASPSPTALNDYCISAPWCTPLSQPLKVDPATPVILFHDPAVPSGSNQIDGMTWDGRASGKVTSVSASSSNPAGTLFVAFPYDGVSGTGGPGEVLDRSGGVVADLVGGPYADPAVGLYFVGFWADDEIHYCQVVPIFATAAGTGPGSLQLTTPGGTPRDVAQVGKTDPNMRTLWVAACSVLADRAVVIQMDPNVGLPGRTQIKQYWVVRLSTGQVLWAHDLSGQGVASVVSSRDGQYVAEVGSTGSTTIYGPSGSAVGHVGASVEGFSWDGSLAVVYACGSGGFSSCNYTHARVIRWGDGRVVWMGPPAQRLGGSQPEPGGTSLAITTLDLAHPSRFATMFGYPTVLNVVSSGGQVLGHAEVGLSGPVVPDGIL